MIIVTLVMPTPTRIKKKLKSFCKKERIAIYSLITGGIGIISLTDGEMKALPICGLLYCGFVYEVIERADPEILEMIAKNRENEYFRIY